MNFNDFNALVDRAREQHPIWFGISSDRVATKKDILEAEDALRVHLPDDYKDFVGKYGGGYFALANVYSLDSSSEWYLKEINHKYSDVSDGYLLVSDNGVGDFYGYKITDGTCSSNIFFYDHEIDDWKDTRFANIFEYLEEVALKN